MAGEQTRLVQQVAARWLRRHRQPAAPPFHLPVGLVSALQVGDRILAMDCRTIYTVTAVGPGALVLENQEGAPPVVFDNGGYADYAWAHYAAPHLHWLLDK